LSLSSTLWDPLTACWNLPMPESSFGWWAHSSIGSIPERPAAGARLVIFTMPLRMNEWRRAALPSSS
jgi:hypothetical protein